MARRIWYGTCFTLLCVVAVLCLTELILRVSRYVTETPLGHYMREYQIVVRTRYPEFWIPASSKTNFFVPPFSTYADSNIDHPEKFPEIAAKAVLEPSAVWKSYDFLQEPENQATSTYVVHSNSLGFRSREYPLQKPPHTFRILVYGTYHAFGYGVNDNETYESVLEQNLSKAHPGTSFEVWNGARPAGTAIDALARVSAGDLQKYHPDLLILDYGMVDANVVNDSYLFQKLHLPNSVFRVAHRIERSALPVLNHSLLWQKIWSEYYGGAMKRAETEDFKRVMKETIIAARTQGVPTLLVREPWAPSPKVFADIAGTTTPVLDARTFLDAHPLPLPPKEEWRRGEWARTWLNELDPTYVNSRADRLTSYQLDLFQLNARGLAAVAQGLQQEIEKNFLHP